MFRKILIKILLRLEYMAIDIAGIFNRLQVRLKGTRWKIEKY